MTVLRLLPICLWCSFLVLPSEEQLVFTDNSSILVCGDTRQSLSSIHGDLTKAHKDIRSQLGESIRQSRKALGALASVQKSLRNVSNIQDKLDAELRNIRTQIEVNLVKMKARDCSDLFLSGIGESGVYNVQPVSWETIASFDVFCDMVTDDGGWTVFQRRSYSSNPQDYFSKTWLEYRTGFGNLNGEFWLGNDRLSAMTRGRDYELRVDLRDFAGEASFAKYGEFRIESGRDNYRLQVGDYYGNAGDWLSYHNRMNFSTKDRDLDAWSGNCALTYGSGWWYKDCHRVNLNVPGPRPQQTGKQEPSTTSSLKDSVAFAEMKIRPREY